MRLLPALVALTTVITSVLAASQAFAQSVAWKWRDAGGQIHVSDLPPPASVQDKDVIERPMQSRRAPTSAAVESSASASAPRGASRTDPELEARRKRAADEQLVQQRQQQEKDAAVRAENCSRARAQLTALVDGQRMARTNAKGEREVLDDKGRAEETQRARAIITSDCR